MNTTFGTAHPDNPAARCLSGWPWVQRPPQFRTKELAGKGFDVELEAKVNVKGAAKNSRDNRKTDTRPTYDQLYLAGRIVESLEGSSLSVAAIQKLNTRYGVAPVVSSMRLLRGFPPSTEIRSLFAYLNSMCKAQP